MTHLSIWHAPRRAAQHAALNTTASPGHGDQGCTPTTSPQRVMWLAVVQFPGWLGLLQQLQQPGPEAPRGTDSCISGAGQGGAQQCIGHGVVHQPGATKGRHKSSSAWRLLGQSRTCRACHLGHPTRLLISLAGWDWCDLCLVCPCSSRLLRLVQTQGTVRAPGSVPSPVK